MFPKKADMEHLINTEKEENFYLLSKNFNYVNFNFEKTML